MFKRPLQQQVQNCSMGQKWMQKQKTNKQKKTPEDEWWCNPESRLLKDCLLRSNNSGRRSRERGKRMEHWCVFPELQWSGIWGTEGNGPSLGKGSCPIGKAARRQEPGWLRPVLELPVKAAQHPRWPLSFFQTIPIPISQAHSLSWLQWALRLHSGWQKSLQMAPVHWTFIGKSLRIQPPQVTPLLPQFIGNLSSASTHLWEHPKICGLAVVPHTGQDQCVEGAVSMSPVGLYNGQVSPRRTLIPWTITPIQQAGFPDNFSH